LDEKSPPAWRALSVTLGGTLGPSEVFGSGLCPFFDRWAAALPAGDTGHDGWRRRRDTKYAWVLLENRARAEPA
jgi:hypothetical protein